MYFENKHKTYVINELQSIKNFKGTTQSAILLLEMYVRRQQSQNKSNIY